MSMELRMLMAIVLSFLVFFLYQVLFVKPTEPEKVTEIAGGQKEAAPEVVRDRAEDAVQDIGPEAREAALGRASGLGRSITVSTPLYEAVFLENSGGPTAFRLKKYRESIAADAPAKEILQIGDGRGPGVSVSFLGGSVDGLKDALFNVATEATAVDVTDGDKDLSFSWCSAKGVAVLKIYTFSPDTYEIGLEIKVRNGSSEPIDDNLIVAIRSNLQPARDSRYVFSGPAALINGKLEEIKIDKEKVERDKLAGRIAWVAHEDQYFARAIIPENAPEASLGVFVTPEKALETTYIDPSGPVPANKERTYRYKLYFGPKSLDELGSIGGEISRIVDFGFFDIIAKPLLHAMNLLYRYIPNYGVVIMIITFIVKALFWPLSTKSYKSMSQMKKLQPKMQEIRSKYKDDRKMMNQEIMNLYKLYKVNPLGGCLPMILQIPVFFAFYKMLYQAIELRHAPFLWWINDLAAPDRLFNFDVKIPLMAPPYGIPVLTIIMGASMFLQQRMSPPPGDPAQAKLMMFMPIFFTAIFINFPSGLVLYWLVNNILSMAQQYFIAKKTS